MPHSVGMDSKSPPGVVKDEPMEEDSSIPNEIALATPAPTKEEATETATADNYVDMSEGAVQGSRTVSSAESKKEVKLEELFADDDSDEDFPSSAPIKRPDPSSPVLAPASPTYVSYCWTKERLRARPRSETQSLMRPIHAEISQP